MGNNANALITLIINNNIALVTKMYSNTSTCNTNTS